MKFLKTSSTVTEKKIEYFPVPIQLKSNEVDQLPAHTSQIRPCMKAKLVFTSMRCMLQSGTLCRGCVDYSENGGHTPTNRSEYGVHPGLKIEGQKKTYPFV